MPSDVQVRSVSKTYTQGDIHVHALAGVTVSFPPQSFACICGPSGSGKTTLLNIIGGLDSPTSGEVMIGQKSLSGMSKAELADMRRDHIGFIFQSYNLIPVLSAAENVEFILQLQGIDARERRDRAYEMLSAVGLSGMEKRRPMELSGGQQQRVAVARAIVTRPDLILADEPTANLDTATAEGLIDLMKKMNHEHGVSFLFSTHDQRVMDHARRIIQLEDGKIVQDVPAANSEEAAACAEK